ncbi:MAG: (d)CMP kinase [Bacteroidota bacterium]|nr:(d)CMP kinase [Bacteroidota bacterium]
MKKIIIAIDGYASTGKSSLAKQLSLHLNYIYVNSGSMYRAIAFFALKNGIAPLNKENIDCLINLLPEIKLDYRINDLTGLSEIYLNNKNIEAEIKTLEVSKYVSLVAEISEIRKFVVKIQKSFQSTNGLVMDGRDIGSVVFPNADLKLFLKASEQVRAKRRYDELIDEGYKVDYKDILENIISRDSKDTKRKDSPLIIAKDAVVIDNSELSINDQLDIIIKLIDSKF